MRLVVLVALLLSLGACAGSRPAAPAEPAAERARAARDTGPKSFAEVVRTAEPADDGLMTLRRDGAKLLAEIPDSLMGREILLVSRTARTAEGLGYGGIQTGEQTVRWERQGDHVLLRTVRFVSVAADSLPIARAVADATFAPVVARLPVAAITPDSAGVLVDLAPLFTTDVPVFGLPAATRERLKVRKLDADRSYLARASAYPENVEVRAVLTYEATAPPTNAATGTLSVEMAHSFRLLPAVPMRPRRADPRVGYFALQQTDYGLDAQRAESRRYAVRWRLVPRDVEAYRRGELVEPVTPITWYIDPATPEVWRPYLKQGVEDWNVAFEQAGFKNAIRALDPPADDPDWSPEDARFSVIRYFPSDIENAFGPHVRDPRSGEILESDIGWYHNVMNLLRNWYFVQTAAVNPDARGVRFRDDVMGELVRFVSAHEVGHTLGLPHNFGSSAAYPVDSLRSPTFTAAHGTAPSIMDYARFNYVAQPGDGVTQLMPRVGEYDTWAVEWGYRYFPDAASEDEERRLLQAMTRAREADPALRYLAQTGDPVDPRAQAEDLGSDGVEASRLGLANLKRIVPNLTTWAVEPDEDYAALAELYGQVVGQWGRYLGHVGRVVGGVESTPRFAGDAGAVHEPVAGARQRAAVRFLLDEAFTRPDWLLDACVLALTEAGGSARRVAVLQEATLARLLEPERLGRMLEAEWLAAPGADLYPAAEMLADLRAGLWAELARAAPLDASRRALQRAHADRLAELLVDPPPPAARPEGAPPPPPARTLPLDRSDARALARAELAAVQALAESAARRYPAGSLDRAHLEEVAARVERALDPD